MNNLIVHRIQSALDVGICYTMLGRSSSNCCRATLYLEANLPPLHALCSTARYRIYLKARNLRSWLRTLVERSKFQRGLGQAGRGWIGKTDYWLNREKPKVSVPAGQDAGLFLLSQITPFLWKRLNDTAHVKNTTSMKSYSESKFEKSRAYLHEITYDDRVIRGVSHLAAMRIGIFSTAEALAKRKRILATFFEEMPVLR